MTNVLLEKKGHIAVATINRPKALNALNSQVLEDIDQLVEQVKADDEIRALVITGSGEKAFVAGADIGEMSTLTKAEGEAFGKKGNDVFRKLETLPVPTIAAVNGFALGGGCELSMSCDIRICADTACSVSRRRAWALPRASAAPSVWPAWWAWAWPSS